MAKISLLPAAEALDGSELVPIVKGGKTRRASLAPLVDAAAGPALARADAAAYRAQIAASSAEATAGPTFSTISDGLAAASDGTSFAVDNGNGTVTVYLNDGGVSVAQRTLATTGFLGSPEGAGGVGIKQDGAGATTTTVEAELKGRVTVAQFGADPTGVANSTAAFTAAREKGSGHYTIPPGRYVLDATPNVWEDNFSAPYGRVTLVVGGVEYDVTGSMRSGWREKVGSTQRYLEWVHARTGKTIVRWSDGEEDGDSHRFYLPHDIRRDSHVFIAAPGTNGGTVDFLWRRSDANADPRGNRFAFNYRESDDTYLLTFATSAEGSPGFEAAYQVKAGVSPSLSFPALRADFGQGIGIKKRSTGVLDYRVMAGNTEHTLTDAASGRTLGTVNNTRHRFAGTSFNTLAVVPKSRDGSQVFSRVLSDLGGDQTAPLSIALWDHETRPNNQVAGTLRVVAAGRGSLIRDFSYDGTTVTLNPPRIDTFQGGVVTVSLAKVSNTLVLSVSTNDTSYTIDVHVDYAGAGR